MERPIGATCFRFETLRRCSPCPQHDIALDTATHKPHPSWTTEMEEDYTACYRVLGLYHRASWTEIRQAYGRAMRRWHPDRHTQNVAARREAEEKTKQIVSAYRRLALYYRQQGCPPPYEPHAASSLRAAPTRPGEGFAAHDVNPSAATTESAATPRRGYRLVRLSFTLGLLTVIGVFVFGRPPIRSRRAQHRYRPLPSSTP